MRKKVLCQYIYDNLLDNPNRIVVSDYGKEYSCERLCQCAIYLAMHMKEKGLYSGEHVVIVGIRSFEYIVSVLAAIFCNCAFVPIDASYPLNRILEIIENISPKLIVNLSKLDLPYNNVLSSEVLSKSYFSNSLHYDFETISNPLVYILFTSGTTGKPKGVMISNDAIMNTLNWMLKQFSFSLEDSIAFKTSISFTDSIWEIFIPLLSNAKCIIINNFDAKNPGTLFKLISKYRITYSQFVPSMLNLVLTYLEGKQNMLRECPLKWIFNGGEYVTKELLIRFYKLFPNCSYANLYGMTESAIYATYYIIDKDALDKYSTVPLGYPLPNMEIFVLDSDNNLCSEMKKGEICISGIGITNGYFEDEKLTSEKLTNYLHKIVYHTGDQGYIDHSGCIFFSGRIDRQVKIRGNRVELFEIENTIMSNQYVEQVLVLVKENVLNENELWCFIKSKWQINEEELRDFLINKLPSYMIPQHYIILKDFPITINNKVDIEHFHRLMNHSYEIVDNIKNDEGVLMNDLRKIWSKILGRKDYSIDDDFFVLGGDSIKLAMLQIYIEKLGFVVSIEELENHRTLSSIEKFLAYKGEKKTYD